MQLEFAFYCKSETCRNSSLGFAALSLDCVLPEMKHSLLLLAVGQAWQKISEESPGDNNRLLR